MKELELQCLTSVVRGVLNDGQMTFFLSEDYRVKRAVIRCRDVGATEEEIKKAIRKGHKE